VSHELARWFADRDEATAAPLRAEIERLSAWAKDEQRGRHKAEEDRMNACSEVERQRQYIAELEDLHCFKGLRADNERLRALLHEAWAALPSCPFRERVRAALEPKP
jgi:hypothetical protein